MAGKDLFDQSIEMILGKVPEVAPVIFQLLDQRAALKDKEINSRLLQELVKKYAASESKLRSLNQELTKKQKLIEADLTAAAEIQRSLLPKDNARARNSMEIAWRFRPCDKIGGDIFNIIELDDDHWAFYMIDVAGHGVQAAMIAVTVFQYLQPGAGALTSFSTSIPTRMEIRRPKKVLEFLDQEYPFDRFNSFFTLNYLVLNTRTGRLCSCNAGHPAPIIVRRNGKLSMLGKIGRPIGTIDFISNTGSSTDFQEENETIQPGDKLLFYTDGLTEFQNEAGELFGKERFYRKIREYKHCPATELVDLLFTSLMEFGGDMVPKDDISLLGVEVF